MRDKIYWYLAIALLLMPMAIWIVASIWGNELGLYPAIGGNDAPACADYYSRC